MRGGASRRHGRVRYQIRQHSECLGSRNPIRMRFVVFCIVPVPSRSPIGASPDSPSVYPLSLTVVSRPSISGRVCSCFGFPRGHSDSVRVLEWGSAAPYSSVFADSEFGSKGKEGNFEDRVDIFRRKSSPTFTPRHDRDGRFNPCSGFSYSMWQLPPSFSQ